MDLFEWGASIGPANKTVQLRLRTLGLRLHSYVVARDYGFAPNPFFGRCTLATCKPGIRQTAQVGDWVVGTSGSKKGQPVRLVFAMKVGEALTFDKYWSDPRFVNKRPNLRSSKKRAFGDNIYHRDTLSGEWIQENSHHSLSNGTCNPANIVHDTQTDRVLVGDWFVYYGGGGPEIPSRFRNFQGDDLYAGRGHKNRQFPQEMVDAVVDWVTSLGDEGYVEAPLEWSRTA